MADVTPPTAEDTGQTPVRGRKWGRIAAKWAALVLIGIAVLIGLIVAVIDTGPGRRFVADQIAALEFENGMKISVGRIDGSLYGRMTLRHFSLRDTKGEFLYSPVVKLDWKPLRYLRKHVSIESLDADRVILKRVPQFRETPPSDAPLLPDLDFDIDRLRIGRFVAEAPVSGKERIATLTGNAHIASGRALIKLDGRTLDSGAGDAIAISLDAAPAANRLAVDLKVNAPRGGTIAALAGLAEPLALTVNGKGDWAAWDGRMKAQLGTGSLADLALTARSGTFAIKGPASLARFATGPLANLLGTSTAIDLAARFTDRRADLTGTVSSEAMRVDADGVADLSTNNFDNLKLAFAVFRPSALTENLDGSGLRGDLTLNGAFTAPRAAYVLNAARLAINDMGLEQLAANGTARMDDGRIIIPVNASARRITGLDTVAGGALANVRLNGDLAVDGTRVLSDNMRIRSDRIDAGLVLVADLSRGLYTGAVDGRIDNYRIESVGIFQIATDVALKTEADGLALTGKVRARSSRLDNSGVRDFLGGNAVASGDVYYGPDGIARITNLRLEAPLLRVTGGRGTYSPDGRIDLVADGISREYGRIGVRLAGTVSNPSAHVTADRPGLGIGLANLDARLIGMGERYRLDLKGDTDYGPLTADVTLGMAGGTSLAINKASLSGIDFTGSLRQTPAGPFAGELRGSGNGLGGVVRLGAQGVHQEALINVRAVGTVLPGAADVTIGTATVDARVILYDTPHIVADAQFSDTRVRGYTFNAGRVLIDYRDGSGRAEAVLEGTAGAPFRIAANAGLKPKLWTVAISGRTRGVAFKTANPARIVPGPNGYELLPTQLNVGSGTMRMAGNFGDTIKFQSRLENFDLAAINAFVPGYGIGGRGTGSLDFEQVNADAFPRADARITLDDFTRTTASTVSEPIDVNFVGKLLPDGGDARAVFRDRGSVIGRLSASLRPLPAGAGSWVTRLSGAPLGGGIRYNGPAETLYSFAGLTGHSISGPVGVAADFSCRVADPCLNGVVRANNLTYENQAYGTRLTKMALSGRFTGNRLEVEKLNAVAGSGTIEASGFVSLATDAGFPMDISATLQNARLARSDALRTRATGNLRLTKIAGATALLSGELRLPETRYRVIRQGAAELPALTGVRFKPVSGPQRITGDEPAPTSPGVLSMVRLDIALKAAERLYVSGMGLESEWKADFKVGGTSAAPTMTGQVELIRGTLGFAGRSFELSEGHIGFTGGDVIDPTLRIVATEDVEDVTVNVNVTGRAWNPQIQFTSVPGLPQDEIMSRVLFGSSIANLSALQAVQLASSLNSLRATGGGLNPMGRLQSATGIDRLRILGPDEANGRGTALAAGQYITNDIYVELITDAQGFTATQLEVSVTPWLSVLSQAGGSGLSNFNVRIKKNY